MVRKVKKEDATPPKRRIKVPELQLNKETIRDLTGGQQKQIKGGMRAETDVYCETNKTVCPTCPLFCQRT
jgi:hypothetical protein